LELKIDISGNKERKIERKKERKKRKEKNS